MKNHKLFLGDAKLCHNFCINNNNSNDKHTNCLNVKKDKISKNKHKQNK